MLITTLKAASFTLIVFGFESLCFSSLLTIFLKVFWSLLISKVKLPAISLISFGKFSLNMLSIYTTKPRATKDLIMVDSSSIYPMAKISTDSVKKGEMIYIEHNNIFTNLPRLPPLAVLVYFKYLKMLRACFTSPYIIMWRRREQMRRIAFDFAVGSWYLLIPLSNKKKSGTNTYTAKTIKHCLRAKPYWSGEQHLVILAQIV